MRLGLLLVSLGMSCFGAWNGKSCKWDKKMRTCPKELHIHFHGLCPCRSSKGMDMFRGGWSGSAGSYAGSDGKYMRWMMKCMNPMHPASPQHPNHGAYLQMKAFKTMMVQARTTGYY